MQIRRLSPAAVAHWSARHRVQVLALTAVAMSLLAVGMVRLEFQDNPQDAMPRGNAHTAASQHVLDRFPASGYASPVFVSVDEEKWPTGNAMLAYRQPAATGTTGALGDLLQQGGGPDLASDFPGPGNITDEVYVRGMEELVDFLSGQVPELAHDITLPSQIRLVNYTNTGIPGVQAPDPAAFTMPGTGPEGATQYSAAWQTYFASSPDSVKSIVSGDWRTTRLAFLFEPGNKSLAAIGTQMYDAVDAYRAAVQACDAGETCELTWNVFDADAIIFDPRAPTAVASYLTKTTLEDLVILGPAAALFIGIALFMAFRRPGTVAALVLPLGIAGLGVLGVFGWINLPIHSVTLLVFPVLMGNGIDFGIHMASAYHDARNRGADPFDAAREAGGSAGTPLVIATATTMAGMLLLLFAPNRLLFQLGLALLLGMVLLLSVSLTALPAALTWTSSPPTRDGPVGRAMLATATFWHRRRVLAAAVIVLLAGSAVAATGQLETLMLGTPAAFFPPGDAQRQDFDRSNELYFQDAEDLVTNLLVLEGDLTTPAAMEVIARLEDAMRGLPFVRNESVVGPRFALEAWIQVRQGTAGAPLVIGQERANDDSDGATPSTFPTTQEGIEELLDEMFATPLANYAAFFIAEGRYDIGALLIEVRQSADFDQLERDWQQIQAVIAEVQASVPGHNVSAHVAGGTAIAYLFTKEELPYVQTASLLGLAMTGALVLAVRRNWRDAATVAAVVGSASLFWIGAISIAHIPLSIGLLVPAVIIAAIGSDYALHLRFALAQQGASAWPSVGRAVFYSAMTDLAAFLVFTRMRYGFLQDAVWATVFALVAAFVATILLVPLLASKNDMQQTPPPRDA